MNTAYPPYVTINEAVALLIRLDRQLWEYGVFEILSALIDEAEQKYNDAADDFDLEARKLSIAASTSRYELAETMRRQLYNELNRSKSVLKTFPSDKPDELKIELFSLSYWAADHYGIDIPLSSEDEVKRPEKYTWRDITIKIYKDYKLRCYRGQEKPTFLSFQEVGLIGKRRLQLNYQGRILRELSLYRKFPPALKTLTVGHKKAMTGLREVLKNLTGLTGDPFYPFNKDDGYTPRFSLINLERVGDERAKKQAIHISLEGMKIEKSIFDDNNGQSEFDLDSEAEDFEREEDDTQDWLDKKDARYR
jgi:hypothetical protein